MILDIESLYGGDLRISYFDAEGSIKLRTFNVPDCSDWTICSDRDPGKSTQFTNWDGRAVKKKATKFLNKFSVAEFIENLPQADKEEITALNFPRVQSIDIETEVIDGFPDPEVARERITCIAISSEDNKTLVLGWKELDRDGEAKVFNEHRKYLENFGEWAFKYKCFANEHEMMEYFVRAVLPACSMVIGWNFTGFDWKYITNRCKRLNISIADSSPSRKVYVQRMKDGREIEVPLHVGMIDYLDVYKKWDMTVKVKESNTLDFVSNAVLGVTKLKYPGTLQELYEKDYDKYVLYNAVDSALVCLIHKKLRTSDAAFSVAAFCNLPIYKAGSPVNLTEALLWKGYYKNGKVIADARVDRERGDYEGAYVKKPEPGFYSAVTCYDYASLYPSIMRQFNISPESFVRKEKSEAVLAELRKDPTKIVTATGAVYNAETSVMKGILADLYTQRRKHKDLHLEIERYLARRKKK